MTVYLRCGTALDLEGLFRVPGSATDIATLYKLYASKSTLLDSALRRIDTCGCMRASARLRSRFLLSCRERHADRSECVLVPHGWWRVGTSGDPIEARKDICLSVYLSIVVIP